jgi:membrane protein implicated in regulation of membrane protease activity
LWEKYVKRDFHPLVFFYVMGVLATVVGVLLGLVVVGYRIAGYSIPVATVVLVARARPRRSPVHAVRDVVRHGVEQGPALATIARCQRRS